MKKHYVEAMKDPFTSLKEQVETRNKSEVNQIFQNVTVQIKTELGIDMSNEYNVLLAGMSKSQKPILAVLSEAHIAGKTPVELLKASLAELESLEIKD